MIIRGILSMVWISGIGFTLGVYLLFIERGEPRLKERAEKIFSDVKKKNKMLKNLIGVLRKIKKMRQEQAVDREIYEAISFMRNVISIESGRETNADFIIERLSKKEGILRETYIKMLSLLRLNKRNEAGKLLEERLNTASGREFAALLLRWDDIDPKELIEVLISHQKGIKEMQLTVQKRREESISDLLYLPVIVNVIFLFINFIYVAYFINQKEMLQLLF